MSTVPATRSGEGCVDYEKGSSGVPRACIRRGRNEGSGFRSQG